MCSVFLNSCVFQTQLSIDEKCVAIIVPWSVSAIQVLLGYVKDNIVSPKHEDGFLLALF